MLKQIPFYASLLEKDEATTGEVLVYGAIEQHAFGEKGCIASNKTIARECGLRESTTANAISKLNKRGWVRVVLDENNHRKRIEPLLEIHAPASLHSEPPFTAQLTPLHSTVNIGNSNKVTVRDKNYYVETLQVYDLYIQLFNKKPTLYKLTEARKSKIKLRLKDAGYEMLIKAIHAVSKSEFHNGKNDRGWKADLDFIIKSYENVEKLSQLSEETDSFEKEYLRIKENNRKLESQ